MGHTWKTGILKYHVRALGGINTVRRSILECVAEKLDVKLWTHKSGSGQGQAADVYDRSVEHSS